MFLKKAALALVFLVGSVVAQASQLTLAGTWSDTTLTGTQNSVGVTSLTAPYSGDNLFVSLTFTVAAGSQLSANDFVSLWFDSGSSNADHTNVPNFGIKSDLSGSNDIFARLSGVAGSAVSGSDITSASSSSDYTLHPGSPALQDRRQHHL
ncbi:MAG: hypothetical protein BSR46_09335 [Candidatus Dactylopiibacterium carminicum]|uniref:hypothetical protein n=1 Tax=Candidatus Dactylopiibacterium carminicum TaxID=857335 RepID=UPI000BD8AD5D|nr:hypothetical protein [Candidatus Dactylopiibacterium carminicum]PAS99186.1 MAG: hypothetical protein BSR46_09335 [Candidatus Dactylopiibacterium carminicum]